jgi:hypothetical protein
VADTAESIGPAFVYIHIAWFGSWIVFRIEHYPYGLLWHGCSTVCAARVVRARCCRSRSSTRPIGVAAPVMMIPFDRVPQLAEDAKAVDALAALSGSEVHRGLVVENGRLAGLFSISNLARARSRSVGGPPRRRGSPRSGR